MAQFGWLSVLGRPQRPARKVLPAAGCMPIVMPGSKTSAKLGQSVRPPGWRKFVDILLSQKTLGATTLVNAIAA
jgi:hypothetical protein